MKIYTLIKQSLDINKPAFYYPAHMCKVIGLWLLAQKLPVNLEINFNVIVVTCVQVVCLTYILKAQGLITRVYISGKPQVTTVMCLGPSHWKALRSS